MSLRSVIQWLHQDDLLQTRLHFWDCCVSWQGQRASRMCWMDLRVLQKVTDSPEELPKFFEGSPGNFFWKDRMQQDVFRCYRGHLGCLRGHPKCQIIEKTVSIHQGLNVSQSSGAFWTLKPRRKRSFEVVGKMMTESRMQFRASHARLETSFQGFHERFSGILKLLQAESRCSRGQSGGGRFCGTNLSATTSKWPLLISAAAYTAKTQLLTNH